MGNSDIIIVLSLAVTILIILSITGRIELPELQSVVTPRPPGWLIADDFNTENMEGRVCNYVRTQKDFLLNSNQPRQTLAIFKCESPEWEWEQTEFMCSEPGFNQPFKGDCNTIPIDVTNKLWDIDSEGLVTRTAFPEIYPLQKNQIKYSPNLKGKDFKIWYEYEGSRGRSSGPTFSTRVTLGIKESSQCSELINPGLGPQGPSLENFKEFGVFEIRSPSRKNPDYIEIYVNDLIVCTDTITSDEIHFQASTEGNGFKKMKFLPNPYINVPWQSCPTLDEEFTFLQVFREGQKVKIGEDHTFDFKPVRFCEIHPATVITSFSTIEDPEILEDLVQGIIRTVPQGEEWVITAKAKVEELPDVCQGIYSKEFNECFDTPEDAIVSRPTITLPPDPDFEVNLADFEVDNIQRKITYQKRIIDGWSIARKETPDLIIGDERLDIQIDSLECGILPSLNKKGRELSKDFQGLLSENLESCGASLKLTFNGEELEIGNGETKQLSENFAVQAKLTGQNIATFGKDSDQAEKWKEDYTITLTLVQIKKIIRNKLITISDPPITQFSEAEATFRIENDIGGESFIDVSRTTAISPGQLPSETIELDMLEGQNTVKLLLDTSSLSQKSLKTDNGIYVFVGNQKKKFKVGTGNEIIYEVVSKPGEEEQSQTEKEFNCPEEFEKDGEECKLIPEEEEIDNEEFLEDLAQAGGLKGDFNLQLAVLIVAGMLFILSLGNRRGR